MSQPADPAPSTATPRAGTAQPVVAGLVQSLVGFTSSFAVVLTGLRAVGATGEQASSGLLALCVTMGVGTVVLAARHRMPLTLAWSTPGAALLATSGGVSGGWPAAVGAFLVVGVLVVLTGLVRPLGALVGRIPVPIAQAMLAGVLLPLCLVPVPALAGAPLAVSPVVVVWLVLSRLAPRWAVPGAFLAAAVVVAVDLVVEGTAVPGSLLPRLDPTAPAWTWQAVVGLAVPLYVVTMASQNVPGVAVMLSFGYRVPWRSSMAVAGVGTLLAAPFGGHAVNLAAISAALSAGPDAHPDAGRRWVAAVSSGLAYLVLALVSAALVVLVGVAPAGVVETVAGLALLGTLAGALSGALGEPRGRESAVVAFVVAASGVAFLGVAPAFWALVAGLAVRLVLSRDPGLLSGRRTRRGSAPSR